MASSDAPPNVLIVGASSGIGEAIARKLAAELPKDSQLTIAARREDRLDALAKELAKASTNQIPVAPLKLDVSDGKQVQDVVKRIAPDVLINCAGVMHFTLLKNGFFSDMETTVDVNCKGTMFSCMAALGGMLKKKKGHIVNISSDAARQTFPALSVYNASKSFVHEFTKGLRCETVGTGVRVTEILPGDVRTGLILQNKDKEAGEKVGVGLGEMVGGDTWDQEKGRFAVLDPKDVADAVWYALSAPAHVGVNEILIEPRDQLFGDPTAVS